MGFQATAAQLDALFQTMRKDYDLYAPVRFPGGGPFSDTDSIRYGKIQSVSEIVLDRKSQYSFKEVLTPVSETLLYFTEDSVRLPDAAPKGAVIFLRSCDLNALRRLDDMYLRNGPEDRYYRRLRDRIKVVLLGCEHSFASCFCVSMGTNRAENYDMSLDACGSGYRLDCRDEAWTAQLCALGCEAIPVTPAFVTENPVSVTIPADLDDSIAAHPLWDEYDSRCINCGRCNFVCPTCTCFTMQDLFYSENGRAGERRRVWASCMVDGFTDVAGGGSYRKKNGQRMRFKVLHKILHHKKRFGEQMCVGCGRCDDICPEYISFSNCINKVNAAWKEESSHGKE